VCMEVGCTSLGSFSARFTEIVGETPSAYRARCHDATAMVPGCVAKIWTRPSRIKEALGQPACVTSATWKSRSHTASSP
jgi:AraC-like DNA-binding protein